MVGSEERLDLDRATLAHPLGTYPTFIDQTLVVNLYSEHGNGRANVAAERAVLNALSPTTLPAPRLIAAGEFSLAGAPYWYLVMTRIEGRSLSAARGKLSARDRRIAAGVLGEWVARLHSVPVPAQVLGPTAATATSIQRPRARRRRSVARGGHHRLWGCEKRRPLYELGPLVTGTLNGDTVLLDEFLRGYGWEIEDREIFARRALATALLHEFGMFSAWRERIASVRSLDELALRFFSQPRARGRVLRASSQRA